MAKNNKFIIFGLAAIFLSVFNCKNDRYSCESYFKDVRPAWERKDTLFFKNYLLCLNSPKVDDFHFYSGIEDISTVSGFNFGNERVCADKECWRWWKLSRQQRYILRHNVYIVYSIYFNSDLAFDATLTEEISKEKVNDKFYSQKRFSTETEEMLKKYISQEGRKRWFPPAGRSVFQNTTPE